MSYSTLFIIKAFKTTNYKGNNKLYKTKLKNTWTLAITSDPMLTNVFNTTTF